jgi:hypothetical protein
MANILAIAGPDSKYKLPNATPAGFWAGLWHGIIAPLLFRVSLISPSVRVYETNNKGRRYDLGFSSAWEPGHRILKHGTLLKALRAEASAAPNRASITAAATKGKMGVQQAGCGKRSADGGETLASAEWAPL